MYEHLFNKGTSSYRLQDYIIYYIATLQQEWILYVFVFVRNCRTVKENILFYAKYCLLSQADTQFITIVSST